MPINHLTHLPDLSITRIFNKDTEYRTARQVGLPNLLSQMLLLAKSRFLNLSFRGLLRPLMQMVDYNKLLDLLFNFCKMLLI